MLRLFRWLGLILDASSVVCGFEFAQHDFRGIVLLGQKDNVSTFASYPPSEIAQYPAWYDPRGSV